LIILLNIPDDIDCVNTTPIDMDLEPEEMNDSNQQVDIDIELRELLESQSGATGEHDTSGIEQMLLD
jgi:hypothetical protein